MRILVAGGTGFVGRAIVRELVAHGFQVRCMTRHPGRYGSTIHTEYVHGDVQDPGSLERAMTGCEVVINCVQFPNHPVENPAKGWTYLKVDGEGTINQVEAAQRRGVSQFIYLSGAGTAPDRPEPWFRAKWIAESAIRESGLDYVIFRPSWIYGPGDHSLNRFVTFARRLPFVPLIGDGRNRIQPLFIKDAAKIIAQSVQLPAARNQVFEMGGPEILTMNEVIQTMLRVMRWERKMIIHQPVGLMKWMAGFMTRLPSPPLSPEAIDFITMEVVVDNSKLLDTFDITLTRLEEALPTYLNP